MDPILTIIVGGTLLSVVTIAFGGTFMLRVLGGKVPANDLQKSFFRAGHAHAGVLVLLGLVTALLTDAADVSTGWAITGTLGVLVAAILIPAGFFLSVLGTAPQRPNKLVTLLWLGALALAVGLVISGVGIVVTGVDGL